jgi:hypothetical protein
MKDKKTAEEFIQQNEHEAAYEYYYHYTDVVKFIKGFASQELEEHESKIEFLGKLITNQYEKIEALKEENDRYRLANSMLCDSDSETKLANENNRLMIEIKELKEVITCLKNAMKQGNELYAKLKFDDEPFTPYQLALQEIKELKKQLEWKDTQIRHLTEAKNNTAPF